jgi:trimeric autotransporter adhesin
MKKNLIGLLLVNLSFGAVAQNWQLTGNTGINAAVNFVGTTDNQKLILKTNNTARLTIGTNTGISGAGSVGIGDVDPDNSLTGGTLRVKGAGTSTAIDLIRATNNPGIAWDNQIRFYNATALRHLIADDYGTGKLLIFANYSPGSGATDIIDIRGRVQIGSGVASTPAGYSLYCEGGILAEKVKVAVKSSLDWSDYIFETGYKLMPLETVLRFTQKNKHLPGVPSAAEVVTNGMDLAKMQSTVLGKVEELFLYTIQLNEELKKLREVNNLLAKEVTKLKRGKR